MSLGSGASCRPDTNQLIAENSLPLSFRDGVLSGPGADFLERVTADSQFVLFGENHYKRDVPIFVSGLFKMLRSKHGFHHLAVEQDPVAIEDTLSAGNRGKPDKLGALANRYPSLFEFGSDQDLQLLAEVGRLEPGDSAICGLEQTTGASRYFDELRRLAPNPRVLAEVNELASMAAKLDAEPTYSVNFFIDPSAEVKLAVLEAQWSVRGSRVTTLIAALRNLLKSLATIGARMRGNM